MKKLMLLTMAITMLSGCVTAITPAISNVPIDSGEIAKSTLVGKDCFMYVLFLGPFGDASIKNVIAKYPGKKITLVDQEISQFPLLFLQICNKVYGY